MTHVPTESTVPQDQPRLRPDQHTGCPWNGATVPTILTAVGPGSAGLSHRVTAGCRARLLLMPSRTAMSVPTLLPSAATVELPGPPNWLTPKVPRVPAALPEAWLPEAAPAAGAPAGSSMSVCLAAPSAAQCPAVRTK